MHTLTVLADREGFPPDVGEFTVIAKTAKGGESNQQQEKVWGKIDRLRRIAFDHGMSLAEAQQMPPNELAAWVQERAEA